MRKTIIVSALLPCLLLTGVTACTGNSANNQAAGEAVKVERGDITVDVSGSGNIEVYEDAKLTFGIGGRINRIYVEEGDEVSMGDVIAELETDALELAQSQSEIAAAKARVDITQAEIALKTAEYNLEQSRSSYTLDDLIQARADMVTVKRDLDEIYRTLSKYEEGTAGWESYQKTVLFFEARVKAAEDKYDAILAGTDAEEVAIKRLQVDLAAQSVELANQSLALANKSLSNSQKQLKDATIKAPFDGIVAGVYVDEKDTVSTMNQIAYLIDPTMMELKVDVDEVDIADIKPGQKAIIEVDALPDMVLVGEVSLISSLPKKEGGVTVYIVTIRFDVSEDSGLKSGMSASADIIIQEKTGVLLVPGRAVKRNNTGDTVVEVILTGGNEEKVVTVGISDGFQTEIISGLEEGTLVVGR